MKLIQHPGIVHAKEWVPQLKGKDLKQGIRNVLQFITDSDFAERCFPLADNPKIAVRAPIGESIALAWFDLTRNDSRIGFDLYNIHEAYEDSRVKGLKKDDMGCDSVGRNINNKIATEQTKLLSDFTHPYTTGNYGLEERRALDSFITE